MFKPTLLAITLALTAAPAYAGWERVKSKDVLFANVVGNDYVNPDNGAWFRFGQGGVLSGGFDGQDITGKWRWSGRMVCFSRKLGGNPLPKDCVTVHLDGKKLATIKNKGKGRQTVYRRR